MIYYYFGSKEGLYLAVLEEAYRRVRDIESELHLQDLEPEQALRRLVAFTFDHHLAHESYIRLVMSENINRGQYLAQSQRIQELNVPAIEAIRNLYKRGVANGDIPQGPGPGGHPRVDLRVEFLQRLQRATPSGSSSSSTCSSRAYIAHRRDNVVEMIVRFVRKI